MVYTIFGSLQLSRKNSAALWLGSQKFGSAACNGGLEVSCSWKVWYCTECALQTSVI